MMGLGSLTAHILKTLPFPAEQVSTLEEVISSHLFELGNVYPCIGYLQVQSLPRVALSLGNLLHAFHYCIIISL